MLCCTPRQWQARICHFWRILAKVALRRQHRRRQRVQPIRTYQTIVAPSDCDFLGHMNVSRYFAACSDGVLALQSKLGLTASDVRTGRALSFAVVHATSDFKAELSAGDAIYLESSILEIGTKSITFLHQLYRLEDAALAFETAFKCVLLDLRTRRATEIPSDVRSVVDALMDETR